MIDLSALSLSATPFRHFVCSDVFPEDFAQDVLACLHRVDWERVVESFYEQYEYSLTNDCELDCLLTPKVLASIECTMRSAFGAKSIAVTDVTLHKLVSGQSIGIHNDFLGDGTETHRLVIHFNAGWEPTNGGYFAIASGPTPESLEKLVQPIHNSAIGFEISEHSHHAVSRVLAQDRYSVIYTLAPKCNAAS